MSTETLRPNASGDDTNLTPNDTDNWAMVDEADTDEEATTVSGAGSPVRDLYNLPASSGSGTINFIKVYFRCKGSAGGGVAYPALKSNSTTTDGDDAAPGTSWVTYSQQWDTNPADSESWEWSDIDALQIGVKLGHVMGIVYCTQVYVEVDYTAVSHWKKVIYTSEPPTPNAWNQVKQV